MAEATLLLIGTWLFRKGGTAARGVRVGGPGM